MKFGAYVRCFSYLSLCPCESDFFFFSLHYKHSYLGKERGKISTPTSWDVIKCLHGRDQNSYFSTLRVTSQTSFNPGANDLCSENLDCVETWKFSENYFPTRAGMIRIISFRVWFEARKRLFRDGDEKQRNTGASQKEGESAIKGEQPCPRRALHEEFPPTLPKVLHLGCESSLMYPSACKSYSAT